MSFILTGNSEDDDAEVEREEGDDDGEEKVQQEVKADNSSATAERTMSDEWEQSKDAACTNGAHEAGACACRFLMQAAASDNRLERYVGSEDAGRGAVKIIDKKGSKGNRNDEDKDAGDVRDGCRCNNRPTVFSQ
jgi:hypothetical protein